ncbi:TPA: NAD(P)-dependent glycerol-1-phosphate dehydrogenase [Methanosarcina acetivorans]|uniref:Glycerol-1-phosphate dehydrogenase [NAD(P)+] n=2 Tax=Methanosarcina acetivorans TaxID=2214 RepID=G1PDH_METAC|nr:NAD(P)-dependent glycerol-1-phosphate dehydrogenase [Methanosarcina acetivorans]Q8TJU1.1 RecName: Full=Glycerol-1-phosphate dehydrogenase [NAD(P)+]; Short=G1P dehydrogenase; Short=G1PDH; AltName: Full=Enantiomeric glycerophosphate synthase; AltName: Full=sn-glycerol-1-phosphate dehydrogenase [Methanosarcina acetivorans C2A]AAM07041.1 glycerol dehydrogenase [Methanosarcina acetivorans C2A]HIH93771.1 NAD(P)-dependent glycerol-1-phosphate dehydrogenase [Methanosarcina acetivorans]
MKLTINKNSAKWMQLPRDVLVGHGVLEEIGDVCRDLKLKGNALIVTGNTTRDVAGKRVSTLLENAGSSTEMVLTCRATMEEVDKIMQKASETGATFLLGIGSGRSIDLAKLASTRLEIPFISVPTAASHDGIASSRASIIDNGKNASVQAQAPIAVVADTEIISAAPFRFLVAGCGDIISNYTAVLDWELASRLRNEYFGEYAAALSRMAARVVIENADSIKPEHETSARLVVKALVSNGVAMSIAGSSRPASGSEHMFSHALDRIAPKPALHGEQCGVGTIMMMYLHGGNWQEIRDALKKIGAPTNAEELGIEDRYIVEALLHAHSIRPDRYTILGNGLTPSAAEKVARITKVIS